MKTKSIYDYKNNVKITTTPNGDKVITTNEAIYISILNRLFDAAEYQKSRNLDASAKDTLELWRTFREQLED